MSTQAHVRAGERTLAALAALASGVALATLTAAPARGDTGDGVFEANGVTMRVISAMAFRGKSMLDQSDAIVVAISNGHFRIGGLGSFHDRRRAIEKRMKDRKTSVVYLEFTTAGTYGGLSYDFGGRHNCRYCGEGVKSTVTLANGMLVGTLKTDDDPRVDVTLDVRVLDDDHGAALPGGGVSRARPTSPSTTHWSSATPGRCGP